MPSVMMACGCRASSVHENAHDGHAPGHPSCVVHGICDPVATPDLTGREAKCYCGRTKPSSLDLAFFEYRGPGSREAQEMCRCGYAYVAHTKEGMARNVPSNRQTVIETGECQGFEAHGPHPTDTFYCGCRGWD